MLLAALVAAVAGLTERPPGKRARAATAPIVATGSVPLPGPDAVGLAREAGPLAVALALDPASGAPEVTVLSPSGDGAANLLVSVQGRPATACGPGCYRAPPLGTPLPPAVEVAVGERTVRFPLPARWPPPRADALLERATLAYRRLRSVEANERLASSPTRAITTRFRFERPNRLAYEIRGGSQAVVIGNRRWDRSPGGPWRESPQQPLTVPDPYWTVRARNARLLGYERLRGRRVARITFLDPSIPAWFDVLVDPRSGRTYDARMIAAAHFMHDVFSRFDEPMGITAPKR
jgi:hypothetical protein